MTRRVVVAAAIGLVSLVARAHSQAAGSDIAVVVSANSTVSDLPLADLRRILLGDRQFWGDRTRITVVVPPPASAERATMLRDRSAYAPQPARRGASIG